VQDRLFKIEGFCCFGLLLAPMHEVQSKSKDLGLEFGAGSGKFHIGNIFAVVGSELIQKYLGDGPKLVRELFCVVDELSPSIVFINKIDVVGTKR